MRDSERACRGIGGEPFHGVAAPTERDNCFRRHLVALYAVERSPIEGDAERSHDARHLPPNEIEHRLRKRLWEVHEEGDGHPFRRACQRWKRRQRQAPSKRANP